MPFETKAVQFQNDVNHGFQTASGLIKLDGEELVVEYQTKDAFLEIFKSDVEMVRIPLRELQSVEFKKGWFSSKIIVEARSIWALNDLPGADQGECTLKIKKKDRKDAENLISKIRILMSEMKLKDLDEDN